MQHCTYATKICDIYDLQKCLTQTWVDFEQNIIEAAIGSGATVWDHCMRAGGRQFEHMLQSYCLFVLCGSLEHFMKLSM